LKTTKRKRSLRYQAGFRAGVKGLINKKFKDPLYLEGYGEGLLRYGKFLASTKDHPPKRAHEKLQIATAGLLDDTWMTSWADSKISRQKPNLSMIEESHSFECYNFEAALA
jgi:hypothetical protein